MRDYSRLRYWIDDFGTLWKGPLDPESTMHYGTFEGYYGNKNLCWVIRRSEEPENAEEISGERACQIVERFVIEYYQRLGQGKD